jgi:hypothetical protein
MNIPDASNQIWKDIILMKREYDFEFLALKILLSRLKTVAKLHNDSDTIQKCANELFDFFVKTEHIPKSQKDLQKIMSKGGTL